MGDYELSLIGIIVSVVLFVLGSRQTIGAKRERVRSANGDLERMLVRRLVLEEYNPTPRDLTRLLEAKARDFRVRSTDLLSEVQLLDNIFTRIVEADLIPRQVRENVLERLNAILAEAESQPLPEESVEEVSSLTASGTLATITMALIGVVSSLVGAFSVVLPEISQVGAELSELAPVILETAVASFLIIGVLILLYRIREESQEEPSKASAISRHLRLEKEVLKILRKAGVSAEVAGGSDRGYDLLLVHQGRKILVELKAWSRPVPGRLLSSVIDRLQEAVSRVQAKEAILVTSTNLQLPIISRQDHSVRIMSLQQFHDHFVSGGRD